MFSFGQIHLSKNNHNFRLDSTKGSFRQEWSNWEQKLREVVNSHSAYFDAIQVFCKIYCMILCSKGIYGMVNVTSFLDNCALYCFSVDSF